MQMCKKSRYNDGIQQGTSSDHRETLLSCVCGKAVERKKTNRKALFTVVGLRDRIAERLLHLSGLTIIEEDLSEFACKKCVTNLDKLTRMQTQSV